MEVLMKPKKLAKIRREKSISRAELSRETGLAVSTIGHLEKGRRAGKISSWVALADALDSTVDELCSAEDNNRIEEQQDENKS